MSNYQSLVALLGVVLIVLTVVEKWKAPASGLL